MGKKQTMTDHEPQITRKVLQATQAQAQAQATDVDSVQQSRRRVKSEAAKKACPSFLHAIINAMLALSSSSYLRIILAMRRKENDRPSSIDSCSFTRESMLTGLPSTTASSTDAFIWIDRPNGEESEGRDRLWEAEEEEELQGYVE